MVIESFFEERQYRSLLRGHILLSVWTISGYLFGLHLLLASRFLRQEAILFLAVLTILPVNTSIGAIITYEIIAMRAGPHRILHLFAAVVTHCVPPYSILLSGSLK